MLAFPIVKGQQVKLKLFKYVIPSEFAAIKSASLVFTTQPSSPQLPVSAVQPSLGVSHQIWEEAILSVMREFLPLHLAQSKILAQKKLLLDAYNNGTFQKIQEHLSHYRNRMIINLLQLKPAEPSAHFFASSIITAIKMAYSECSTMLDALLKAHRHKYLIKADWIVYNAQLPIVHICINKRMRFSDDGQIDLNLNNVLVRKEAFNRKVEEMAVEHSLDLSEWNAVLAN